MKSAIAVGLCMLVYFVRTLLPIENGIPFYGALAALWCMQQYNDTTKTNAVQRSVGTLIGALYGLVFLLLFRRINVTVPMIVYISASAVIIPVIYTTVVLNKRNASFFLLRGISQYCIDTLIRQQSIYFRAEQSY